MKIRNGFVSNSSSSSFIIIGYRISDELNEKMNDLEHYDEEDADEIFPRILFGGENFVGKRLLYNFIDNGVEEISLKKITDNAKELKKILKKELLKDDKEYQYLLNQLPEIYVFAEEG